MPQCTIFPVLCCPGSYRDEPTTSRAELSSTGILHLRGAPTYSGQVSEQKVSYTAIFLHFPEAQKVFDIQNIYGIGMHDFFR